jgi:hypothetical protein
MEIQGRIVSKNGGLGGSFEKQKTIAIPSPALLSCSNTGRSDGLSQHATCRDPKLPPSGSPSIQTGGVRVPLHESVVRR